MMRLFKGRVVLAVLAIFLKAPLAAGGGGEEGLSAADDRVDSMNAGIEELSAIEQYNRALRYAKGEGVERSPEEAVHCLRLAADQGYAPAQFKLGVCYAGGYGVENKDLVEAVKWYEKAADQGYSPAQFKLGECYEEGKGVEKNSEEAKKWYEKAADQGYPPVGPVG